MLPRRAFWYCSFNFNLQRGKAGGGDLMIVLDIVIAFLVIFKFTLMLIDKFTENSVTRHVSIISVFDYSSEGNLVLCLRISP